MNKKESNRTLLSKFFNVRVLLLMLARAFVAHLREQPFPHLGISECGSPRIVLNALIYGKARVSATLDYSVYHLSAFLAQDRGVTVSVECPNGKIFKSACVPIHSAAADGYNGSKQLGTGHGELPCGVAAHACAHKIHSAAIHVFGGAYHL